MSIWPDSANQSPNAALVHRSKLLAIPAAVGIYWALRYENISRFLSNNRVLCCVYSFMSNKLTEPVLSSLPNIIQPD